MRAVEWDVRDAWVRDGGEGRGLDLGSGLGEGPLNRLGEKPTRKADGPLNKNRLVGQAARRPPDNGRRYVLPRSGCCCAVAYFIAMCVRMSLTDTPSPPPTLFPRSEQEQRAHAMAKGLLFLVLVAAVVGCSGMERMRFRTQLKGDSDTLKVRRNGPLSCICLCVVVV